MNELHEKPQLNIPVVKNSCSICPKCNQSTKSRDLGFHTVYYCTHCLDFYSFVLNYECCKNPKMIMVKNKRVDGNIVTYNQCENCGFKTQGAVPHKHIKGLNIETIPNIDLKAIENRNLTLANEKNEFVSKFLDYKFNKGNTEITDTDPYYSSDEWMKRRELVLKRDENICQSCLNRPATQVHHLTYSHFRNEPLFDLVAICQPCHEIISKIDKKIQGVPQITYNCF